MKKVEKERYEKPMMKIEKMKLNDDVAVNCFASGDTYYYDTEGPGYFSFKVSGGSGRSCTGKISVTASYTNYEQQPTQSETLAYVSSCDPTFTSAGSNLATSPGAKWS